MKIPVILVAGGTGKRMGTPVPKQYLDLGGKPMVLHSFDHFIQNPYVSEIVVVCEKSIGIFFLKQVKK